MTALPNHLHLHVDAADGIARTIETLDATNRKLIEENDDLERRLDSAEQEKLNLALRLSLIERRLLALEQRVSEVGSVSDRNAQFLTAYALTHRTDAENESLADQIEYHRAQEGLEDNG